MLYVFYVDLGKRLVLDMNLVNECVLRLKHAIEESQHIPTNKQVLLISGGECLDDSANVCRYSAGTDTNPIYLFNRSFLEKDEIPVIGSDFRPINVAELDSMYERIEHFDSRNVSFYSLNIINELAQKYLTEARSIANYTNELNADALSQQQGWAAAIANLDDVMANFKSQCETFDNMYTRYLETRQENIDLINGFSEDLKLLSKIPLLPALLEGNEEERARLELCYDKNKLSNISLLDWIEAKEPEQSLEAVVDVCRTALEKYDEPAVISLRQDIEKLFNEPEKLRALRNNSEISEKLTNLSCLIVTIRKTFEDQEKKADGISLNHKRATDLKDDTILPDLVETHKNTLLSMKSNHLNLRSCRQMCLQAKKELCYIIHKRLKAVMTIQEQAAEIRSLLVLQGGNMKRMRDYIELIRQLHTTPINYCTAVSEVVRRRSYSQAFLMWASDLACRIFAIYTDETERRSKFLSRFEGHFLKCLFPGLDDIPPNFATQSPPLFDNNLPPLCEDDLKHLCQKVPNLEDQTSLPDVDAIRNFFLSKSLTLSGVNIQNNSEAKVTSLVIDQMCSMSGSGKSELLQFEEKSEPFSQNMIISDNSCSELRIPSLSCVAAASSDPTQMIIQSTNEEELPRHDREMQSLRDKLTILGAGAHKTVISLRRDLSLLREWVYSNQSEIVSTVETLYTELQKYRNVVHMLSEQIGAKDDQIKALYCKISEIETERMARDETEKLEKARFQEEMCASIRKEKEVAVKEATDKLANAHKKEIELLRQRLKLLTFPNVEHGEAYQERIERDDLIAIANHEAMMDQLRFTLDSRMNQALDEERSKYETVIKNLEAQNQLVVESMKTSLLEDFNRQIEVMRQRENSLVCELQRHRETIHTLTDPEGRFSGSQSLLTRIEELERDKNRLQAELLNERKLKYSYPASGSPQSGALFGSKESSGSTTSLASNSSSPELQQNRSRYKERVAYKKSRASSSYLVQNKICLESCNVGDPVLVVWDDQKKNYTILQDSDVLHFVHPVSIDLLGLRPASDGSPRKLYCPAEVIEKEYCASKRMKNRYNLEEGERFYRVKVKPLANAVHRLE